MARDPGPGPSGGDRRFILGVALGLALVGHAAWAATVDTSSGPFLPRQATEATAAIRAIFPAAIPITVRVVVVVDPEGNVLTPGILAALGGLRNGVASDETVAAVLAPETPVASLLSLLEPHLEGAPGEWDEADVRAALARVTNTSEGERALAGFLDRDARLEGSDTRARSTVLVVRLDPTAEPHLLASAQERIAELAQRARLTGVSVSTDAPLVRDAAVRSLFGLWVPLGTGALVFAGGAVATGSSRRAGGWTVAVLAASGGGLLVGVILGHSSPFALILAAVGATLGAAAALSHAPPAPFVAPSWTPALVALPFVALALWTPAGAGELAAIAGTSAALAALAPQLRPRLTPAEPPARRRGSDDTARRVHRRLPPLAGPVLVTLVVLVLLSATGLPTDFRGGWTGAVPRSTDAGRAAGVLDTSFGGPGPGAEIAVVAWGPVIEPRFLSALAATAEQFEGLSLAAASGSVESVLSLGRDWAADERAADPTDEYDATFARLWADATGGGPAPTRDGERVIAALLRLDPEGTMGLVHFEDPDDPRSAQATLLRQRITVSGVVPHPGLAVAAAVSPLVAASERIAISGTALEEDRARTALVAAGPLVLLVTLLATAAAGLAWVGRTQGSLALGAVVAAGADLAVAGTAALHGALGLPAGPASVLAPALAGGLALAVGGPLALHAAASLADGDEPGRVVYRSWKALRAGARHAAIPWAACLVVGLAAPADGLRFAAAAFGLATVCAASATSFGLSGLLNEWARSPRSRGPLTLPSLARLVCPECGRPTATGVSRCAACGRWNVVASCPVHPESFPGRCAQCDEALDRPHFA